MSSLIETFGWLSAILTMTTFVSPIAPFIKVVKGKLEYENTPTFLIGTGYCNCFAWYCYGIYYENPQLKFCSIIGVIVYLIFIIIYLAYETKKYLFDAILNALILLNGTWAAYRTLAGLLTELELLEKVCIGTTCAFNIYPLYLIYKVVREKNHKLISDFTAIGTIASGFFWIVYGLRKANYFFVKWQILGIVVSIAEISVYYIYKNKFPVSDQINEIPTVDIEITGNEEANNKNADTVDIIADKIDDDADETDKIKEKPVEISSK